MTGRNSGRRFTLTFRAPLGVVILVLASVPWFLGVVVLARAVFCW